MDRQLSPQAAADPQIRADLGFETPSESGASPFRSQADALSSAMFALGSTRAR
jgi:hypothetical protein